MPDMQDLSKSQPAPKKPRKRASSQPWRPQPMSDKAIKAALSYSPKRKRKQRSEKFSTTVRFLFALFVLYIVCHAFGS